MQSLCVLVEIVTKIPYLFDKRGEGDLHGSRFAWHKPLIYGVQKLCQSVLAKVALNNKSFYHCVCWKDIAHKATASVGRVAGNQCI